MSKNNKLSEALRALTSDSKELFGIKTYAPKVTQNLNETAKFAQEDISKDDNNDLNESEITPLDKSFIRQNLNDQTFGPNCLNSSIKSTNSSLNNAQLDISLNDLNESEVNPLDKSFIIETPNDQTFGPNSLNSSIKSANSSLNNAQLDNHKPTKTIEENSWGIGTLGNRQQDMSIEKTLKENSAKLLAKLKEIKNTLIDPTTRPRSKAVNTNTTNSINTRSRGKAVMVKTNPSSRSR